MSHFRLRRRHASARNFVTGLLLTLGLLAGCQSDSDPAPNADAAPIAGLGETGQNGTGIGTGIGTGDVAPGNLDPRQAALAELTRIGDRVLFDTDRYDISGSAEATLRGQAALLQAYPAVTVTIEGHADERGTREYNLALADRRAQAVRNYLGALGVAEGRIETVSYGKEKPACADASAECWASNRRGVTVVNQ
jgi:peptidoglycan-associated lipoprotein